MQKARFVYAQRALTAKTIFLDALEIASSEARRAYLDDKCTGDQPLRAEVEELLRHHAQIGPSSDQPAVDETQAPLRIERPGTVIGPYKLMEQIGEGGMGLVFVAEQHEPVRRKVALKLIKPGMDSRQIIARFEAERQALALMDHPNIARVLDAGTIGGIRGQGSGVGKDKGQDSSALIPDPGPWPRQPAGRTSSWSWSKACRSPTYCDENRLSPRERLELFTHVCHAVQHAHQKGIIHRDIKPTNVLVALARRPAGGQGHRLRRGQGRGTTADREDALHRIWPRWSARRFT